MSLRAVQNRAVHDKDSQELRGLHLPPRAPRFLLKYISVLRASCMKQSKFLMAVIMIVAIILAFSEIVTGAVPQLMNYQGMLLDSTGIVVPDGNYSVTFRFYDDSIASPALWQEGQLVTVKDGLFQVLLGGIVAFPADLFESLNRWLGVQVGLNPEIQPRTRITTMAYAFNAASATHARIADTAMNVVPSACYHRIAFDSVGGSDLLSDFETWVQVGNTITISANTVTQYILVTVLVETSFIVGNLYCDIRIGAEGQEQSRCSVLWIGSQTGVNFANMGASTLTYYYAPTQIEKSAGFNVQFFMRGGYDAEVRVRKADIFGM